MKVLRSFTVLTMAMVMTTCYGCAAPVELRVSVHDRLTSEPVEDALVVSRYYAHKLRSQPPAVGGRTDENGTVVLKLVKRDLPMSVTISVPDHRQLQLPVSMKDLIASGEIRSLDDRYPNRTLDVVLKAVVNSPRE